MSNTSIEINPLIVNYLKQATDLMIAEQGVESMAEDERYLWLNRNCIAIVAKAKSLEQEFITSEAVA
jgi:hypothetical protein